MTLPEAAVGLQLYRFAGERLIACEAIQFKTGYSGVEIVLRRARISGRVDIGGDIKDHFADVLDESGTILETVALDRKSYSALKNKWMRCRVEPKP